MDHHEGREDLKEFEKDAADMMSWFGADKPNQLANSLTDRDLCGD